MKIPRGQTPERQAYMKAWNAANPRNRHAYKTAYDVQNKSKNTEYRARNRDHLKAHKAAWYQANRNRILARVKAHAAANQERILVYQAKYYQENSDRVRANVAAYRTRYPDKKTHLENRRRARKAGNGGSHSLRDRIEKFALLGDVCFYCGADKPLTVDHDIPLSRGGTDDIRNILPACRSCNSKKNAHTATEFIRSLRSKS